MSSRFEILGLQCSRWKASKPDELTDVFYDGLNPLQKACAQSHINIWKLVVESGLPYVFIMEDDACFDIGWREKLGELELLVGGGVGGVQEWDGIFLNASEPMLPLYTWKIIEDQYFCGGYILSRGGAEWLLNEFGGCFYSADWMSTRMQLRGRSYSYYPWLIIQEGFESTIGSGVLLDHSKVVRCLSSVDYSLDNYIF
jgi:GR25 family glycosyltransferase involved in LPS biosynthesis